MNSRRIIILVVALALGGLASFGIYQYTQGVRSEAYAGAELTSVWVVSEPIPKGTPAEQVINQGLIVQRDVPVDLRPTTAIVDPAAELGGLIAIADLPANHQVVVGNFVAPSVVSTGVTDRLSERGLAAVSISVDQVKGVAGLLAPGDFVNIMVQEAVAEEVATAPPNAEEGGENPVVTSTDDSVVSGPYVVNTRMLFQKAEILAIDTQLAPDLGEEAGADAAAINSGMLTLAVPPEAALRLASIDPGSIYLSLVPPDYEPYEITEVDYTEEFLPGEDAERLTPYPAEEADDAAADEDEGVN